MRAITFRTPGRSVSFFEEGGMASDSRGRDIKDLEEDTIGASQ